MRLATIASTLVALTLGVGNSVWASQTEFYPPERIDCRLMNGDQIRCEGFDRQVLREHATNAELRRDIVDTFFFVSGLAYFTPGSSNATVFFSYNDSKSKLVQLITNDIILHPDASHGSWRKFSEGVYVCDESYMACSLTNR